MILNSTVSDARLAALEFDGARAWLEEARRHPMEPLAAEVWVTDPGFGHVLLVKHRIRGWVSPGGKVEPGETPREAAARELLEETGLRAELLREPAAVAVRSYRADWSATLGLSYAAIVDRQLPLGGEKGQPAAPSGGVCQAEDCVDAVRRCVRAAGPLRDTGRADRSPRARLERGAWLKGVLGIAAAAAARSKSTYLSAQFRRLVVHRGKERALVAVEHSILVSVWHFLTRDIPYQDLGADDIINRIHKSRQTRRLVSQLTQLGYNVPLQPHQTA